MPHAKCVYCGSTQCTCFDTDEEYEAEAEKEKAAREYYQRAKPTPDQILAESGQPGFIPQGVYMELTLLRHIARKLLKVRLSNAAESNLSEATRFAEQWATHYDKE